MAPNGNSAEDKGNPSLGVKTKTEQQQQQKKNSTWNFFCSVSVIPYLTRDKKERQGEEQGGIKLCKVMHDIRFAHKEKGPHVSHHNLYVH